MLGLLQHMIPLILHLMMKYSQMDGSTEIFTLSKPLENNVVYNVYPNGKRIDDPNFGTANQTNTNAVMFKHYRRRCLKHK